MSQEQTKVSLWLVTEWKDGTIFRTKFIKNVWITATQDKMNPTGTISELAQKMGGTMFNSLSTAEMSKGYDNCYRRVSVNSSDYIQE